MAIADIAGLVGNGGDVLLVAYVEGSECCTITRASESCCRKYFIGNLAGGVEFGDVAVFLYHPEAAISVGINLGSTTTVTTVCVGFTLGVLQCDSMDIVIAATILDLEVYNLIGTFFGEPYTAVVERTAECYGSTGDDTGCIFLHQYTRR